MAINLSTVLDRSRSETNSSLISWEQGNYLNATFCVTEECNLECTYCYMVGKNSFRKMSFETGKAIVDYLLNDPYTTGLTDNLMIDFIGGEPLLEMDLIDKITDYISLTMYVKKHKWFNHFQISFSTNGTLYGTPTVAAYLEKHKGHCGFGFSIDGTKEKHDQSRVMRDGNGSYDKVIQGFKKYKNDFGDEIYQKSTFSSDDLSYLKDSIIHLMDLGFTTIESNLVYEDVWKPGDPELFENQLKELADYMFESGRYLTHTVAYFEKRRGLPLSVDTLNQNRCGAGYKSLAFDCEGNIYPCIRFLDMCAADKSKKIVGHISTRIDYNALRALCGTTYNAVSDEKCNNCEVGTDCGWCVAQNFQENGTVFKRVTAICEMHKANARANKYYWRKYEEVTGYTSDRVLEKVLFSKHNYLKYLYFITSDNAPAYCNYSKLIVGTDDMSIEIYRKGMEFCLDNEILPIFLGGTPNDLNSNKKVFFEIDKPKQFASPARGISVVDSTDVDIHTPSVNYIMKRSDIIALVETVKHFHNSSVRRLNIFISDIEDWGEEDLTNYEVVLGDIVAYLHGLFSSGDIDLQINILTDRQFLADGETRDCAAGINSIALAPNGKFYICPGFYFTNPEWSIGSIETGLDESEKSRYFRARSAMCCDCKATACTRCLLNNKITTSEVNIPSSNQCRIAYIQANAQKALSDSLEQTIKTLLDFNAGDLPRLEYVDYVANMIYGDERSIAQKWMY